MKSLVVSSLKTVLLYGIKWAIFVKQSTTTKIESKLLDNERSTMKSMEMEKMASLEFGVGVITYTDDVEGFLTWNKCHM